MRHSIRRGACAILERDEDDKILLHLRSRSAWVYPRCWAFIGGGVERGESAFAALRREWLEELGYPLSGHKLFDVSWHHKGGCRVLDFTFIAHWYPWQRLRLCEGQAIRWFRIEEALALPNLPPHERAILTMLLLQRQKLAA